MQVTIYYPFGVMPRPDARNTRDACLVAPEWEGPVGNRRQ
jgi:hypothetical protein